MMSIHTSLDFRNFPYYPVLRSRDVESSAFRALPDNYQNSILPVVTLFRSGKGVDLTKPLNKAKQMMNGRPFLLDVDLAPIRIARTAKHDEINAYKMFIKYLNKVQDSYNGFEFWRAITDNVPNAIPVSLLLGPANEFANQLKKLIASKGKVGIRVRPGNFDINLLTTGLLAIKDLSDVVILIDFESIGNKVSDTIIRFHMIRNAIRQAISTSDFSKITFVCIGTSFPFETAEAGLSELRIREAEVFSGIGGFSVAQYGDYAGLPARPQIGGGPGYPRVVGPEDSQWIQCRGNEISKPQDYIICAAWVKMAGWLSTPGLWGSDRIDDAAAGNIAKMGSATKWLTVRVNIHLYRQLNHYTSVSIGVTKL
jgi:hypothetical protein